MKRPDRLGRLPAGAAILPLLEAPDDRADHDDRSTSCQLRCALSSQRIRFLVPARPVSSLMTGSHDLAPLKPSRSPMLVEDFCDGKDEPDFHAAPGVDRLTSDLRLTSLTACQMAPETEPSPTPRILAMDPPLPFLSCIQRRVAPSSASRDVAPRLHGGEISRPAVCSCLYSPPVHGPGSEPFGLPARAPCRSPWGHPAFDDCPESMMSVDLKHSLIHRSRCPDDVGTKSLPASSSRTSW